MAGLLYVTMQPRLQLDQFHEWYNNEHGPDRLRLPHIFQTGQRYQSTDSLQPSFVATYDIPDMSCLTDPVYTSMRAQRSAREATTIAQVAVQRHMFDLKHTLGDASRVQEEGTVLIYVDVTLKDASGEAEVNRWYDEEHFGLISKVPGWLRSRRFRTSELDLAVGVPLRIVTLHEYAADNGLGGTEHKASMETPWRATIFSKYVEQKSRRKWSLFYTFGPAPRDLEHLAGLSAAQAFVAPDKKTATFPGAGAIESYVTTEDGLEIPYRLEGSPAPNAPVIAFSNSLLTSLHMWDDIVATVKTERPDLKILRYDTRGRHALPKPPVPATMEMLTDDLAALVRALRIPRLAALVGVSLGGATALQFGIKYPEFVAKIVACDCNVAGSAANTSAWKDRIALAEGADDGMERLANVTVARWFALATADDRRQSMRAMISANPVEGFKYSCQALWDFDLKEASQKLAVPTRLVVGEADGNGALVKAMQGFGSNLGTQSSMTASLKIVPNAGHLPMFEQPDHFWKAVQDFL